MAAVAAPIKIAKKKRSGATVISSSVHLLKKALEKAGEQKKADFQRTAVETEIATINSQSSIAKAKFEKLLEELGE